jgi:hypothetical protein
VVFLGGFGVARVSDSARVDPTRTLFRLASVSKLFVGTAVMQQVGAGRVRMDEDVNRRTSGLSFDRDARERIFAPMVSSRPYPVGLAYSTASDMARFISAQLSSSPLLSDASLTEMQRQHFTADSTVPGMSYVWFNQMNRGYRVLAHGGNVPGFNNLLLIVPTENVGFYFVTNGGRTAFGAALRDSLLALLLPRQKLARSAPAKLTESWVRSLAGNYQITRYVHRTIEAFPSLFATSITIGAQGTRLVLPYPNGAVEFEPVDSLHFRQVDGDRAIAFLRDTSGRVTLLAAPLPVFGAELPATLEPRSWQEGAHFMNEYVSWLLLGPLIILAAWGAVSLGVVVATPTCVDLLPH